MSFELIFHPFHYHYNPTVNNNNNSNNGDNNNINRYSVVSLTWLWLFHNVIAQLKQGYWKRERTHLTFVHLMSTLSLKWTPRRTPPKQKPKSFLLLIFFSHYVLFYILWGRHFQAEYLMLVSIVPILQRTAGIWRTFNIICTDSKTRARKHK